jgi:hypothetical protein
LLIVGILVLHPIYANVCEPAEHGASQKCEQYHVLLAMLLKVGQVLSHAETWTALATIAIAVFTYTLKRSTDKLWAAGERQIAVAKEAADAAKTSADHIPRVERAYMFCGPTAAPHGVKVSAVGIPTVQLEVINYGTTPGILKNLYGEWSLLKATSDIPVYEHGDAAPFDLVVARGEKPKVLPVTFKGPPMSLAQLTYTESLKL